jgi:adenylate cyclase
MASTRRLTAILAADVAGYSRLMGADEEGTHQRLRAHFAELVDPKIREHRGHTVKNTGDGLLAEFASVVDAVRCAAEIQRGMIDREPQVPDDRRIRFRIGVNLGDVIVEDDDIFGDGVNIAARLEALAEPGGICISRTVRDQIRDKLPYSFEDQGEQSVKNVARPVRVYALSPEAVADLPESSMPPAPAPSISQPSSAPRLSIVVLPFAILGNDPDQQYFADGITEDLTTDLSRIADMFVISRNTAFTYRDKRVDTKQIGRELGVRYVLEGSVRRLGSRVRVNAHLIDAEPDAHLWADRFDGDTSDLFALQDEITSQIAFALGIELTAAEAAHRTEHADAMDYLLRGRVLFPGSLPSRRNFAQAVHLLEQGLGLAPQSAEIQTYLAGVLVNGVVSFMTDTAAADLARAEDLIDQALATSSRSPYAHYVKGTVLRAQSQWNEAILHFERSLSLNRNLVGALQGLGWCKLFTGSLDEVIQIAEQAIRIGPRDPTIGFRYLMIGTVHLLQSRVDEAILWFEKGRNVMPDVPNIRGRLAAAYALRNETERAIAELAEARRLAGEVFSSIARVRAAASLECPKSALCTKPPISPGCARPGCRRSEASGPAPGERSAQILPGSIAGEEDVRLQEKRQHQRAIGRAGHMPAALRSPHVIAGAHFTLVIDEAAFEHKSLLDLDMLVERQFGAGLPAEQRRQ